MKKIIELGSQKWQELLDHGLEKGLLDYAEATLIRKAVNIEKTGKIPTDKQIRRLSQILEKLEEDL